MRKPSSLHIPVWTQFRLRFGMVWLKKYPTPTKRQCVIVLLLLIIAYNALGRWVQESRTTQAEKRLQRYERPRVSASLDVTHPLPAKAGQR